jgi:hypothetical protein
MPHFPGEEDPQDRGIIPRALSNYTLSRNSSLSWIDKYVATEKGMSRIIGGWVCCGIKEAWSY